jgi:hypothetical protein
MATHIYVVGAAVLCAALAGSAMAAEICRGTDPRCYHDWAKDKRDGNRVLIYTRTAGPRHGNLGPPLAAGLNPTLGPGNIVQSSLRAWLAREGIEADWTEDVTSLTNLNRYKAVIFASTSRDALFAHSRAIDPSLALNTSTGANLDAARTALRQYMRAGGGFVGIHNAFGTEYNWPWYEGLLGDTNFYDHGEHQRSIDRWFAEVVAIPGRVVQPRALPNARQVSVGGRREDVENACAGPPRPRRPAPGGLVPVLRRRPRMAHDARP